MLKLKLTEEQVKGLIVALTTTCPITREEKAAINAVRDGLKDALGIKDKDDFDLDAIKEGVTLELSKKDFKRVRGSIANVLGEAAKTLTPPSTPSGPLTPKTRKGFVERMEGEDISVDGFSR